MEILLTPKEYNFLNKCSRNEEYLVCCSERKRQMKDKDFINQGPYGHAFSYREPRATFLIELKFSHLEEASNHRRKRAAETILKNVFSTLCYSRDSVAVRDVLKLSKESNVDIWAMFTQRLGNCFQYSTHKCLILSPRNFIQIADFGGTTTYNFDNACWMYLLATIQMCSIRPGSRSNFLDPLVGEDPNDFRPFQLLCLYLSSVYKNKPGYLPSDFENALQVVWGTIPDPLLTLPEFTRSFERLDERCSRIIFDTWGWYCTLVRGDIDDSRKCPRSLKHLSRCAVRHRLKECFQLPDGVDVLNLPTSVKQYLLLRDPIQC